MSILNWALRKPLADRVMLNAGTGYAHAEVAEHEFLARVMRAEAAEGIPSMQEEASLARFLLPKVIQEATDMTVMERLTVWMSKNFPAAP